MNLLSHIGELNSSERSPWSPVLLVTLVAALAIGLLIAAKHGVIHGALICVGIVATMVIALFVNNWYSKHVPDIDGAAELRRDVTDVVAAIDAWRSANVSLFDVGTVDADGRDLAKRLQSAVKRCADAGDRSLTTPGDRRYNSKVVEYATIAGRIKEDLSKRAQKHLRAKLA